MRGKTMPEGVWCDFFVNVCLLTGALDNFLHIARGERFTLRENKVCIALLV